MSKTLNSDQLTIRPATSEDCDLIMQFIRELAEFEQLTSAVTATSDSIRQHLFGTAPVAEAIIGEINGSAIGYGVFYTTFSTFTGKPGLYLEDLYVRPGSRKRGLGRAMISHIAGETVRRGYARLEWSVLDWNQTAIDFYRSLGTLPLNDWIGQRLSGARLEQLAGVVRTPS